MNYQYFTSESVASGHPDKICDQISDAILDACLAQDKYSHTAIECLATVDHLTIAGEVKSKAKVDYEKIARKIIRGLGYTDKMFNFTDKSYIDNHIHQQSQDIALGVDNGGAGDQGMMFGYATDETEELMPLPILLAHRLVERLDEVRNKKILSFLRPDGKSEVKVQYEKGVPKRVVNVVLAVPHDPEVTNRELKKHLFDSVVNPVLKKYGYEISARDFIANGTGKWEIGGPASDTGVTGRKIIVDTYGGMGRHGGGCFSGKDPTKVDRSGAYAVRFIAKNIIAHGFASRCEVAVVAYIIGKKQPIAKSIETFGNMPQWVIFAILSAVFADLVAIFGKVGISGIDTTLATTIRAIIMAVFLVLLTLVFGKFEHLNTFGGKAIVFIILSGIAGALSWLFYFFALKNGPASGVVSLDRLSIILVLVFAVIFLSEELTARSTFGAIFMVIGAILMSIK